MLLTIQIVNYNSREYLFSCLDSLRENISPKIKTQIVVVNNDRESLGEKLKNFDVELLERGENIGFGKAHNLGAKIARGEYLFLLNPDTKVFPGTIRSLLDLFSADAKIGIATPLLLGESGLPEEEHFGPKKTPLSTIFSKLSSKRERYFQKEPFEADWVSGAAMMIRKDLFNRLGGFYERYFMYFEDVDLCTRARKKEWKVMVDPRAKVFHKSGQSFSDNRTKKKYYYRSQEYYIRKNFGSFWLWVVKVLRFPFYFWNVYCSR